VDAVANESCDDILNNRVATAWDSVDLAASEIRSLPKPMRMIVTSVQINAILGSFVRLTHAIERFNDLATMTHHEAYYGTRESLLDVSDYTPEWIRPWLDILHEEILASHQH